MPRYKAFYLINNSFVKGGAEISLYYVGVGLVNKGPPSLGLAAMTDLSIFLLSKRSVTNGISSVS